LRFTAGKVHLFILIHKIMQEKILFRSILSLLNQKPSAEIGSESRFSPPSSQWYRFPTLFRFFFWQKIKKSTVLERISLISYGFQIHPDRAPAPKADGLFCCFWKAEEAIRQGVNRPLEIASLRACLNFNF